MYMTKKHISRRTWSYVVVGASMSPCRCSTRWSPAGTASGHDVAAAAEAKPTVTRLVCIEAGPWVAGGCSEVGRQSLNLCSSPPTVGRNFDLLARARAEVAGIVP